MGNAVVHFEIEGRDAAALRAFYAELFDWQATVDPTNPAEYGLIDRETNLDAAGHGISGAISRVPDEPSASWKGPTRADGYRGHVTVVVEVSDVEVALRRAEQLGGRRMQGPDPLFPGIETGKLADPEGHLIGLITATHSAPKPATGDEPREAT